MSRSTLYVPSDRPERFGKALASGADAIICDLEDAVAENSKVIARQNVAEWLSANSGVAAWVRVNNRADLLEADALMVRTLVENKVDFCGVIVPKADPVACAVDFGGCPIIALVESAVGVMQLHEIAAVAAVVRLALGEEDLAADLGLSLSANAAEMWPIRSQVVVASAAAGLQAPCGAVFTNLNDDVGLTNTSTVLCRQGFGGRSVIHPKQVQAVNDAFTPSQEEIAKAKAVVGAFDKAAKAGSGVAVVDNKFVDAAVVRWAQAVLSRVPATLD